MPPPLLMDLNQIDFDRPAYDINAIRQVNPQRGAMEHLTAVVHVIPEKHTLCGYKDVTDKEFWIEGHMPGFPLMPGVIMCECIAQLAGFYARKYKLLAGDFVGFGGMNEVRFRAPVFPNCRLILIAQVTSVKAGRRAEFDFQGIVNDKMVFSGSMIGVPISSVFKPPEDT
ncbi:MAG: Beta-hydroxyacyl-(acyl-carrier-protein) dehydratase FabA/FabZ [Planctomycetaceae bacterium]|nr:Beta-hydroxyacyl-(acyl-carrier-protein) dehydratase FabA/FabZ [Planctomycetaceae bacterium]